MIHNIVFDIGGVLADYRLKEFLADKGFDDAMIRRIVRASVYNPCWGRFERGEVSEEETMQAFIAADPAIGKELRLAYTSLTGMLTIRDYAISLVQSLKAAEYGVYYLSNYSRKAFEECGESLAFMPYMDGGIVSFRVGLTKPDPRMFQCLLERYELRAEECVLVDDTEENVSAAKALGFAGVVFRSREELLTALEELGVRQRP